MTLQCKELSFTMTIMHETKNMLLILGVVFLRKFISCILTVYIQRENDGESSPTVVINK